MLCRKLFASIVRIIKSFYYFCNVIHAEALDGVEEWWQTLMERRLLCNALFLTI